MVFLDEKIEIVLCAKGNTALDPHARNAAQRVRAVCWCQVGLCCHRVCHTKPGLPRTGPGLYPGSEPLGALFCGSCSRGDVHSVS